MNKKAHQEKIEKLHQENQINNFLEAANRARSVTVGTCFGGTVEVSMRRSDGTSTFAILQPVEVVEIINQLSAGIGCHIHIYPRKDFASWRDWKYTEAELEHYRGIQHLPGVGHPPHANDMAPHQNKGQTLPPPEQQPGLQSSFIKDGQNETVAIEKSKNKRSTKRTATVA